MCVFPRRRFLGGADESTDQDTGRFPRSAGASKKFCCFSLLVSQHHQEHRVLGPKNFFTVVLGRRRLSSLPIPRSSRLTARRTGYCSPRSVPVPVLVRSAAGRARRDRRRGRARRPPRPPIGRTAGSCSSSRAVVARPDPDRRRPDDHHPATAPAPATGPAVSVSGAGGRARGRHAPEPGAARARRRDGFVAAAAAPLAAARLPPGALIANGSYTADADAAGAANGFVALGVAAGESARARARRRNGSANGSATAAAAALGLGPAGLGPGRSSRVTTGSAAADDERAHPGLGVVSSSTGGASAAGRSRTAARRGERRAPGRSAAGDGQRRVRRRERVRDGSSAGDGSKPRSRRRWGFCFPGGGAHGRLPREVHEVAHGRGGFPGRVVDPGAPYAAR